MTGCDPIFQLLRMLVISAYYLWFKAFHVISVIAWMAGLFYLPRLMVYHCAAPEGSDQSETFKVMEHRLLYVIATPAMVASWLFGLIILFVAGGALFASGLWLPIKLFLALVLSLYHGYIARQVHLFREGRNTHSAKFFRIINEIPTLIVIAVIVLVTVRPV